MKIGDLVKPTIKCGGQAGNVRCKTAVIITENTKPPGRLWGLDRDFEILCKCGVSWQYTGHLEVIDESR